MNKRVNSLRYMRAEENNDINNFKVIDITDYDEVYCNEDWFVIYNNNNYEQYIKSNDLRVEEEITEINCKKYIKTKKYPSKQ